MTDTGSTGFTLSGYRVSRGKNVVRGVHVPVVFCPTGGARPATHVERQLVDDDSARGARLGTGEETIDLDQVSPVPFALVRQERKQHSPRRIRDDACEAMILHHPSNVEVFDYNHLVFANEPSRQLLEMVTPPVGNASVQSGKFLSSLVSVVRSFHLSAERPGEQSLSTSEFLIVARVVDLFTSRECGKRRDAKVDTDRRLESWHGLDASVVAKDRNVPTPRGIKAYRHTRRVRVLGKRATPSHIQWSGHLRKSKRRAIEAESAARKAGRPALVLALETGIGRALCEEVGVRGLQVSERLLERHARHLAKEGKILGRFPRSQLPVLRGISDRLLRRGPRLRSSMQRLIVDETDAANGSPKQRLLLGGRIESEPKRANHVYSMARAAVRCKPKTERRFLPCLPSEAGASTPKIR